MKRFVFDCWKRVPALLLSLSGAGIFFSSLSVSATSIPTGELDPSWQAVLEFAAHKHLQFGSDIVFTYGPLGFLFQQFGFGEFRLARVLFAVAISAFTACAAVSLALHIKGLAKGVFLLFLVIFPTFQLPGTESVFVYVSTICVGIILIERPLKNSWAETALVSGVCVFALIKFTFFMASLLTMVICVIDRLLKRDRRGARDIAFSFAGLLLALWLILGQTPRGFLRYVRTSEQITAGYTEAMSVRPSHAVLLYALIAVGLFTAALGVTFAGRWRSRQGVMIPLLLITTFCFLAWKEGFVRADGHVLAFLYFLPVASALIFHRILAEGIAEGLRRIAFACYLAATSSCILGVNALYPGMPSAQVWQWDRRITGSLLQMLDENRWPHAYNVRREDRLQQIARKVGDDAVDVFNYRQAVLLLNGLNYRPRPVIQGYSTYTSALQLLNLNFYRSDRSPRYILFRLETIDDRFPTLDDAPTISYVLNNYLPVFSENGFLLLQRNQGDTQDIKYEPVYAGALALGQKLDLKAWNDSPLFLRVDASPTLLTRLTDFIYQTPPFRLAVELDEGSTKYFRFVSGMAANYFLVSPLVGSNENVIDLLNGDNTKRVQSISVLSSDDHAAKFKTPLSVVLYRSPNFLSAARSDPGLRRAAARLKYPMFSIPPITVTAAVPPQMVTLDGTEALLVHAPGTMIFEVPPGAKQLSGKFGILQGAYTGGGKTEGVDFIVEVESGNGKTRTRPAFEKLLRPKTAFADRGIKTFSIPLRGNDRKVLLMTNVPPHVDGAYDWSAWSGVEFR